jgi:hypothetical protein
MFLAGKPEYFLGVMNWLNHAERWPWLDSLMLLVAALSAGGMVYLARSLDRGRAIVLVLGMLLLAGALGPWASLQLAKARYRLPDPHTDYTRIAFEGEHSRLLLPTTPSASPPEASFQTFYVWTQRLGYIPSFEPTLEEALARADVLVLVDPFRPFEPGEVEAIEEFVSHGGKLLVLADPRAEGQAAASSAQILAPFGLNLETRRPASGAIQNTAGEVQGQLQVSGVVTGGDPLLSLEGEAPLVALARHGDGLVVATAFARPFSDREMGTTATVPNRQQRLLYEIEYWLLRGLVSGAFPPLRVPESAGQ